jgi:hypothetical protein
MTKKNKKSKRKSNRSNTRRLSNRLLLSKITNLSKNSKRKSKRKRKLKRTTNLGMTVTSAPVALGSIIETTTPFQSVRIKHREFVEDIVTDDSPFKMEVIPINPGLPSAFPWLAEIAQHFESYIFNSLEYHYITVVPTDTAGATAICPDYDAADDNSTLTKQRLFSFEDSVRGPIWQNITMSCKRSNLHKMKEHFVRMDDLAANLDIKTYDVLQLMVAISGNATESVVGELWVTYDISLFTPQLNDDPASTASDETGSWDARFPFSTPPYPAELDESFGWGSEDMHFHRLDNEHIMLHPNVGSFYQVDIRGTFDGDPGNINDLQLDASTLTHYPWMELHMLSKVVTVGFDYVMSAILDFNGYLWRKLMTDGTGLPIVYWSGATNDVDITTQVMSMSELSTLAYSVLLNSIPKAKEKSTLKRKYYKLKQPHVSKGDCLRVRKMVPFGLVQEFGLFDKKVQDEGVELFRKATSYIPNSQSRLFIKDGVPVLINLSDFLKLRHCSSTADQQLDKEKKECLNGNGNMPKVNILNDGTSHSIKDVVDAFKLLAPTNVSGLRILKTEPKRLVTLDEYFDIIKVQDED